MAKPAILPGCAGVVAIVTASVLAVEGPQLLSAVTEIVPPLAPVVTVMEVVVLVPVHPLGKVQV